MKTIPVPQPRSGFALGTVMVLSLIMLTAVGALLAYANDENRNARRNQLATEAFHLAEKGIEIGCDAVARAAHTETGTVWTSPSASRYKRTIVEGNKTLLVYLDKKTNDEYRISAKASIAQATGLSASKAITTEFKVNGQSGTQTKPGPAIAGKAEVKLGLNGNSEPVRLAAFDPDKGPPVWDPQRDKDINGNTLTKRDVNCLDSLRVVCLSGVTADLDIGESQVYGHILTKAPTVKAAFEPNASGKSPGWVGEYLTPLANTKVDSYTKPYAGWTELADIVPKSNEYAGAQWVGHRVLVDGKCIEQNSSFTQAQIDEWFAVPPQPTYNATTQQLTMSGTTSTVTAVALPANYSGSANGNVVTWPASGEGAAYYVVDGNMAIGDSSIININGPVTLVVTQSSAQLKGKINFGPNGSLSLYCAGNNITVDMQDMKERIVKKDGKGDIISDTFVDAYHPEKLRIYATGTDGSITMHPKDGDSICAEVIAPNYTVNLHAVSTRSTFIGRIIGKIVTTTNRYDFFFPIKGGGGNDNPNNKTWSFANWRQVLPSTISDSMPVI